MKRALRRASIPLMFYYAVTLALPLANGAGGSAFLKHAAVVLAIPPALILLFCGSRGAMVMSRRVVSTARGGGKSLAQPAPARDFSR